MLRRYPMRTMRNKMLLKLIFLLLAAALFLFLGSLALSAIASYEAKQTVRQFYDYEKEGKFAESWGMFHSTMQEKFSKSHYIQDRAHVFMNHFGVTTFQYSLGRTTKIGTWSMSEEAEPLEDVYRTTIRQTYEGKYGNFLLEQKVYSTKEDGRWTVLWDYNRSI